MQKQTTEKTTVLLTADQLNLVRQALDFLNDSSQQVYTIAGYAGTGKSFTVKYLIQEIDKCFKKTKKIIALTPTHKAKSVLEHFVKGTRVEVMTLHKGLGIRPTIASAASRRGDQVVSMKFNADINKVVFSPAAAADILIIDEASMISTDIWCILNEMVAMINADRTISRAHGKSVSPMHLIAVGDPGQLPPVGELKSPAFTNVNFFLEHIVRQAADNPVLDLATRIRQSPNGKILSNMSPVNKISQSMVNGKLQTYGYRIYTDEGEFNDMLMNTYATQPLDEIKLLAWTNSTVKRYNNFIRNAFISNTEPICLQDVMMTQDFNHHYNLENSKEYRVDFVEKVTAKKWFKGNYYMAKMFKGLDPEFLLYRVKITSLRDSIVVPVAYPDLLNYQRMARFLQRVYENPNDPKAKDSFYSMRKRMLFLEDVVNANGQVLFKKDLDYAYALTIHKSQGSTYKKVFIYGRDMDNAELEKELLYVAITRSAEEVHILV